MTNKIHIADGQTDKLVGHIHFDYLLENNHERNKQNNMEIFNFTTFANQSYSKHLSKRNRIIIPGEDGELRELTIFEARVNRIAKQVEVYTMASYLDLKKSKVIKPHKTTAVSAERHAQLALAGTEIKVGDVAFNGVRTLEFESYTNPFDYLKRIASEFDLELDFRVEIENGMLTRYADLVERVGAWRGRIVELGRDLLELRRIEKTDNIVTALHVIGPLREDGTRLEVFVEDKEALQRWGRNGQHLVDVYEPMSIDQDISIDRLTQVGEAELAKRINASVSFVGGIADLESIEGMENKKIRFGDTMRIKVTSYDPPLYLEARVYKQSRDIKVKGQKQIALGDYIEYTEDEVKAIWKSLQAEIAKKIKNAESKASIGDIKFTIISYKEPLTVEKSSIDSRFDSLHTNLDLSTTIRATLSTAKTNYNNAYNVLLNTINTKTALEDLSDSDLQEVNSRYASYDMELSALTRQFEMATNDISQKKANDAEDKAKEHTDDSLIPINQAIGKAQSDIDKAIVDIVNAQSEIDQAIVDLGTAQSDIENAQGTIDTAIIEIGDLETALEDKLDIDQAANDINNGATRILGKNIIIDGDALVTGTIGASAATFLNMTTRDMTAINATMQNSTVTGNLTATNATFLNGTFDHATIVDATIQNATITGTLQSVDGTFVGNMTAGSITSATTIDVATDLRVGDNIYLSGGSWDVGEKSINFYNGKGVISAKLVRQLPQDNVLMTIEAQDALIIKSPTIILDSPDSVFRLGTASIDSEGGNARWRQSVNNYIRQDVNSDIHFFQSSLNNFTFSKDIDNHAFLRGGQAGLKFLNSSLREVQARNSADTAYTVIAASDFKTVSSEKWKHDIKRYNDSALAAINQSVIYDYIKDGVDGREVGLIIERETPDRIINGEGLKLNSSIFMAWKAIQELDESTNKRIMNTEVELQMLKERVRQLEMRAA